MTTCDDVADRLSGYVDGELTQGGRQRVDVHLEGCDACRRAVAELRELKERMQALDLGEMRREEWREMVDDTVVQTSRSLGWILFIGGAGFLTAYGILWFLADSEVSGVVRFAVSAVFGGLTSLFVSVLRERMIRSKTDPYNDVEI